jgi:hypothetical protein
MNFTVPVDFISPEGKYSLTATLSTLSLNSTLTTLTQCTLSQSFLFKKKKKTKVWIALAFHLQKCTLFHYPSGVKR